MRAVWQYYLPANVSFSVTCGSSVLSLFQWQTGGYDRGSVQRQSPPLTAIIESALAVLGFTDAVGGGAVAAA